MFLVATGLLVGIGGTVAIAPCGLRPLVTPRRRRGASLTGTRASWTARCAWSRPGWEVTVGGTWPLAVLLPQVLVAGFLTVVVLYPYLEEWTTEDRRDHHVLDQPRDAPNRTALGVAGLTFSGSLWAPAPRHVTAPLHLAFEPRSTPCGPVSSSGRPSPSW